MPAGSHPDTRVQCAPRTYVDRGSPAHPKAPAAPILWWCFSDRQPRQGASGQALQNMNLSSLARGRRPRPGAGSALRPACCAICSLECGSFASASASPRPRRDLTARFPGTGRWIGIAVCSASRRPRRHGSTTPGGASAASTAAKCRRSCARTRSALEDARAELDRLAPSRMPPTAACHRAHRPTEARPADPRAGAGKRRVREELATSRATAVVRGAHRPMPCRSTASR